MSNILCLLKCSCGLFICLLLQANVTLLSGDRPEMLKGVKILLDPGHGVKDSRGVNINKGAKANGLSEQDVVVEIADLLGSRLSVAGCEVYYTRNKSNFWRFNDSVDDDNYNRAYEAQAYNADAFIRLHLDWSKNKKASGARTFYLRRSSKGFAESIQKSLVNSIKRKDLGTTQDWFKGMEEINMPCVLVEMSFISNPAEAALLKKHQYLENCAQGIYEGIIEYFNGQPYVIEQSKIENNDLITSYP